MNIITRGFWPRVGEKVRMKMVGVTDTYQEDWRIVEVQKPSSDKYVITLVSPDRWREAEAQLTIYDVARRAR